MKTWWEAFCATAEMLFKIRPPFALPTIMADQAEPDGGVRRGRRRGHCGFRPARRNVLRRDQDGRYRDLNHPAIAIVLLTMVTDRIWQSAAHLGNWKEVMNSLDLQFPPGAFLMPAVGWLHMAGDEHAT
jgi:hypothetical protein